MEVTPELALLTALASSVASALGAMLGLGGGVFLVPVLVQGLHIPLPESVAISLTTVIATSNAVSSHEPGRPFINLRLGFLLEVATVAGGLLGTVIAARVEPRTVTVVFSIVMAATSVLTFLRRDQRTTLSAAAEPGRWGSRYPDPLRAEVVSYRPKRLPLALVVSGGAGILSTLLGIGGGVVKVPVLNAWCGVPIRVASATNVFMVGITAASGAIVYLGRGLIVPELAAAAVVGVGVGSTIGLRLGHRFHPRGVKVTLAALLLVVAAVMLRRLP